MTSINQDIGWKARWVLARNRLLGSARFQQWASRTPLVRGVAKRKAAAQFDLVAGFVYSQILTAIVESGLIEFLNEKLCTVDEIASQAGLEHEATERLLLAGDSLRITESPQAGLWTLGEEGAALSANAGAMTMIRHHHLLYQDLAKPLSLLAANRHEETALSSYWTYAAKDSAASVNDTGYSALMAATLPMVSQQIIDAYDFSAHRRMLDVGGGSGMFVEAVAAAAPALRCGVFDLPDVVEKAASRLGDKVELHPGSFKRDSLPQGYDLITLVRILHDHDDDVAQALLNCIYAALPDGGRLLIVEPMADSAHATRMGHAYFGLYLWAMNSGRPRTVSEITDMLAKAGFARVKKVRTALPIIASALVATK